MTDSQDNEYDPQNFTNPAMFNKTFAFAAKEHSPHLNCPFCTHLMINGLRLHPCGHVFCHQCVQNLFSSENRSQNLSTKSRKSISKTNKQCPQCQLKIQVIQKDLLVAKLIGQLEVRCLNEGCPWKGELQSYKKFHRKECRLKGGMDQWLGGIKKELGQGKLLRRFIDQQDQDNQGNQDNQDNSNSYKEASEKNNSHKDKYLDGQDRGEYKQQDLNQNDENNLKQQGLIKITKTSPVYFKYERKNRDNLNCQQDMELVNQKQIRKTKTESDMNFH